MSPNLAKTLAFMAVLTFAALWFNTDVAEAHGSCTGSSYVRNQPPSKVRGGAKTECTEDVGVVGAGMAFVSFRAPQGDRTRIEKIEVDLNFDTFIDQNRRAAVGHSVTWQHGRCYKTLGGHYYFDRHFRFGWPPTYIHERLWGTDSSVRCYIN